MYFVLIFFQKEFCLETKKEKPFLKSQTDQMEYQTIETSEFPKDGLK